MKVDPQKHGRSTTSAIDYISPREECRGTRQKLSSHTDGKSSPRRHPSQCTDSPPPLPPFPSGKIGEGVRGGGSAHRLHHTNSILRGWQIFDRSHPFHSLASLMFTFRLLIYCQVGYMITSLGVVTTTLWRS